MKLVDNNTEYITSVWSHDGWQAMVDSCWDARDVSQHSIGVSTLSLAMYIMLICDGVLVIFNTNRWNSTQYRQDACSDWYILLLFSYFELRLQIGRLTYSLVMCSLTNNHSHQSYFFTATLLSCFYQIKVISNFLMSSKFLHVVSLFTNTITKIKTANPVLVKPNFY